MAGEHVDTSVARPVTHPREINTDRSNFSVRDGAPKGLVKRPVGHATRDELTNTVDGIMPIKAEVGDGAVLDVCTGVPSVVKKHEERLK